jgi:hypothetical protein
MDQDALDVALGNVEETEVDGLVDFVRARILPGDASGFTRLQGKFDTVIMSAFSLLMNGSAEVRQIRLLEQRLLA